MIEEPEGPHPHHHKSGVAWLDLALALSVLALSIASLLTAQHSGHTMERLVDENSRLVRANATPILQFSTMNVTERGREIRFNVSNVGTGPARVIWFELAKAGVAKRNAADLVAYVPKASEGDYITTGPVASTYLPAGEVRQIFAWKFPPAPESQSKWTALDTDRYGLVANACFCSVLGECWTSHLAADLPRPVKACDPAGHTDFKG